MSLAARVPGGEWFALRTLTTGRYGRASFRFAPRRSYEYRATFPGRGVYLGDDSRPVTVTVERAA
ncbi:MAG TPA: hypothetical protein VNA20_13905 [Frankiaceae bacterium]|nr:hypothetical protein [Frankiaceae bacterium]